MRLERLTPDHLREAVEIYLARAYPESGGREPRTRADQVTAGSLEEVLARFERPKEHEPRECARYELRLGNHRYPFMKLVVQEYLVENEYFLSVDTHDDLKVTPDMPDYDAWRGIREYNAELKTEVERAWTEAGLPTNEDLCAIMEDMADQETPRQGSSTPGPLVLVVDDEQEIARGLQALLVSRGYRVELAFDGRQVVERMLRDPLPDLVLLDYSMPELNGEQVMREVRGDPRCRDVPILLATATSIDLGTIARASGLLRKPYPREVLLAMIGRLLEQNSGGEPAVKGPS